MAKRSLQASEEGAKLARKIFDRRGWTQEGLAAELDLRTRQPIWRFFTSRPIERHIFIELCTLLDLDWMEIAEKPPEPIAESKTRSGRESTDLDRLVQQVRLQSQEKIEYQCGMVRLLGINNPVDLEQIYVEPKLVSCSVSQLYIDTAKLEVDQSCSLNNLRHQRLADFSSSTEDILEQYSKLRISGIPGSGKTTLLKSIALRCIQGKLLSDHLPIFIQLGNYVQDSRTLNEFNLLRCIQQELSGVHITDSLQVEQLLHSGKCLLLLDELDEVAALGNKFSVLREIERFSERYYKNHIVLASRLVVPKFEFLHFTDFEITEFDDQQIELLASHWFYASNCLRHGEGSLWLNGLIHQLRQPDNQLLRELAGSPLLLNRICQTFQTHNNLSEQSSRIYEECFQLLFAEWDEIRGSQSLDPTQTLTPTQRLSILYQIAAYSAEQGRYFLNQAEIEQLISTCLSEFHQRCPDLPQREASSVLTDLMLCRYGLLIQQAKGLFSLSHRAFQDYLIVQQILATADLRQTLSELLTHLTNPYWRGVFLLLATIPKTRKLILPLMRSRAESFVVQNSRLARLLNRLQIHQHELKTVQELHQLYLELFHPYSNSVRWISTLLNWITILAQRFLLQSTLIQLLQATLDPRQAALGGETIQSLLDHAIELSNSLGYHYLLPYLCSLEYTKDQINLYLMGVNTTSGKNSWLNMLKTIFSEMIGEDKMLIDWEQIEIDQPYLYAIGLFQDCWAHETNTEAASINSGLQWQYVPQFDEDLAQPLNQPAKSSESTGPQLVSFSSPLNQPNPLFSSSKAVSDKPDIKLNRYPIA